jgi:hypothetical protein
MLATHTAADADLWGHLRFGADVIATGHLPARDPYSFTSDIPWVNHEWLSEAALAAAYSSLGALSLNLLKLAIVAALAGLVWRRLRRAGATAFSAAVTTSLLVMVTTTRTGPIRPQLFSILCFALLLTLLEDFGRPRVVAEAAVAALFCVWANAHGGWIVGLGVLTIWAVAIRRPTIVVAAAAGTLANPYGFALWRFMYDTVGLSRPEIVDWMPLYRLPPAIVALECLGPALAIAAVVRTRRLPASHELAAIAALSVGTVRVSRIDAFLHLAIVFACAPAISGAVNDLHARVRRSDRLVRARTRHALVAAALIVVTVVYADLHLGRIAIEGEWKPDASALQYIKANVNHSRLVTWFDWGEYAIWHLSQNGIVVSMDGRRETIYGDRVLRDHFGFYRNDTEDAWRYPDRIGADRVWLPTKLPIVAPLRAHGWYVEFETPTSVLLSRRETPRTRSAAAVTGSSTASFPGP